MIAMSTGNSTAIDFIARMAGLAVALICSCGANYRYYQKEIKREPESWNVFKNLVEFICVPVRSAVARVHIEATPHSKSFVAGLPACPAAHQRCVAVCYARYRSLSTSPPK
jgi:hypothetical protein